MSYGFCYIFLRSPTLKHGAPAVEQLSTTSPSSAFTNCEFDLTDNFLLTPPIDFNDSIDSLRSIDSAAATDSNSDYNDASDIVPISSSEKFGVTTSVLYVTTSTSVSV